MRKLMVILMAAMFTGVTLNAFAADKKQDTKKEAKKKAAKKKSAANK